MRKILLVYSLMEPYRRYVDRLRRALESKGADVIVVDVETSGLSISNRQRNDVIVTCTNTIFLSTILRVLDNCGAMVINRGILLTEADRACILSRLNQAEVKVPRFWMSCNVASLYYSIPQSRFPVIIKSHRSRRFLPKIIRTSEELRHFAVEALSDPLNSPSIYYCEQFLGSTSFHLKVYGCRGQYAVLKKSNQFGPPPTMLKTTQQVSILASTVESVLELDFFSIDLVEVEGNLFVVDVNHYPIYKYFMQAYEWLAEFLVAKAIS